MMHTLRYFTVCLVAAVTLAAPALAGFDEGSAALEKGDYATALREWRPLAEKGHAGAQFSLGRMSEVGQGVPKDDKDAVKWYRRAAEQGNADAQLSLGWVYSEGQGVPKDDRESAKWLLLAAKQGLARAQFDLGRRYEDGKGVPENDREATKWYRGEKQDRNDKQN
jgi:TPR repeat protein